ncbi:MAG: hypothetical protein D6741_19315, partial [Planctomycetota bacterium]
AEAQTLDAKLLEDDSEAEKVAEALRTIDGRIAENREQIATLESTIEHDRERIAELEADLDRYRKTLDSASRRAEGVESQRAETEKNVEEARREHQSLAARVAEEERVQTEMLERLDARRALYEQHRVDHWRAFNEALDLGKQITKLETHLDALDETRRRVAAEVDSLTEQETVVEEEQKRLAAALEQARQEAESASLAAEQAAAVVNDAEADLKRRREELASLREKRSALAERANILAELEERAEGVGPAVQSFLEQWKAGRLACGDHVHGMLADLMDVGLEAATLIDIVLGDKTQAVVVDEIEPLVDAVARGRMPLGGRITFLPIAGDAPDHSGKSTPEGVLGVLGPAVRFIDTSDAVRPLVTRLLGDLWIVENAACAMELRSRFPHLRWITLAGELLDAGGMFQAGPKTAGEGILSRRSMLRSLAEQLTRLDGELKQAGASLEKAETRQQQAREAHEQAALRRRETAQAAAEAERRLNEHQQRYDELRRRLQDARNQLEKTQREHETTAARLQALTAQKAEADRRCDALKKELDRLGDEIATLEEEFKQHAARTTESKVRLAKCEERLTGLEAQLRRFEQVREERRRELDEAGRSLAETEQRLAATREAVAQAEARAVELYDIKQQLENEAKDIIAQREAIAEQRRRRAAQIQEVRRKIHAFGRVDGFFQRVDLATHFLDLCRSPTPLLGDRLALRDDVFGLVFELL